jgi:transcription antitermination factor NusG
MLIEFPSHEAYQAAAAALPWYALQVKSLHEFHVVRELERFALESYLPTRLRKHWRQTEIEVPLIPGYVFARALEEQLYGALRYTGWLQARGGWIIGDRTGAIEIPVDQIETLKIMVAKSKVTVVPLADVWQGDEEIEVVSGPLAGCRGRVARCKGQLRLVVVLEMLGSAISAELDADTVMKVVEKPVELEQAA